jgi:hypothetical protein
MNKLLTFKDPKTEISYYSYSFKRRERVLQLQKGATGLFSFLGIFHQVYFMPKQEGRDNEIRNLSYIVISALGLLVTMLMPLFPRIRHTDSLVFFSNLYINFVLIEPNFLSIEERRPLSSSKHFWLGFRISAINLVLLLCYNSFIFKILQTKITLLYLMIRMRKDANVHNLLVDSTVGILICVFFYFQEKGERKTFLQLHGELRQKKSWKKFLNFLPEGIAIFSKDYNCTFINDNVKNMFKIKDHDRIKNTLFNLTRLSFEQEANYPKNFSGLR